MDLTSDERIRAQDALIPRWLTRHEILVRQLEARGGEWAALIIGVAEDTGQALRIARAHRKRAKTNFKIWIERRGLTALRVGYTTRLLMHTP